MQDTTIIHLVRHGLVHNPDGIVYGRLPKFRLSDTGQQQARATALALGSHPLAAIFCSPLLRAQQTALILMTQQQRVPLITDERLVEIHTVFEGQPESAIEARGWDAYTGIDSQYEQPDDIAARLQCFINYVRKDCAGQEVAAVSHGDVIAFAILQVVGAPLTPTAKLGLQPYGVYDGYPKTASITTLVYHSADEAETPEVVYLRPYHADI